MELTKELLMERRAGVRTELARVTAQMNGAIATFDMLLAELEEPFPLIEEQLKEQLGAESVEVVLNEEPPSLTEDELEDLAPNG